MEGFPLVQCMDISGIGILPTLLVSVWSPSNVGKHILCLVCRCALKGRVCIRQGDIGRFTPRPSLFVVVPIISICVLRGARAVVIFTKLLYSCYQDRKDFGKEVKN